MRERPILFNGAMVRAILAGQKTQTRRVVKGHALDWLCKAQFTPEYVASPGNDLCPFGQPGDRLWVRETHAIFPTHGQHRADGERWGPWGGLPTTLSPMGGEIAYYREGFDRCDPGRWRPSIHMPRWACRLVLEITAVRVERLQAISAANALAEGIEEIGGRFTFNGGMHESLTPRLSFQMLCDSTGGDWASNPWVWVIEFKRVEVAGG